MQAAAAQALAEVLKDRISAEAGFFERCRLAYVTGTGSASLRLTALDAELHEKWAPSFGVALTDSDGFILYKVVVRAKKDPLRLVEPQQHFGFAQDGKAVGNAVNEIVVLPSELDLTVDFGLEWFESGFLRVKINGQSLGFIRFSRPPQQWNILVTGMTLSHDSPDLASSECL